MQAFSCQHREQYISKWNYEISVVQEIHFSRLEPQRWYIELVISFPKVFIWDSDFLGLRFGGFLLGSHNPNLNVIDEFSIYIFLAMKS
jgi:hypothetical protein